MRKDADYEDTRRQSEFYKWDIPSAFYGAAEFLISCM